MHMEKGKRIPNILFKIKQQQKARERERGRRGGRKEGENGKRSRLTIEDYRSYGSGTTSYVVVMSTTTKLRSLNTTLVPTIVHSFTSCRQLGTNSSSLRAFFGFVVSNPSVLCPCEDWEPGLSRRLRIYQSVIGVGPVCPWADVSTNPSLLGLG